MKIPGLTASMVEGYAAEGSFERGREYVDSGAVLSVRRTGPGHLEARVKGGHFVPYTVDVRHDDDGIAEVECSCPYFAGGWCKHIVAALLAHLEGTTGTDRSELLTVALKDLDRDELEALWQAVSDHHPDVVDWALELLEDRRKR